MFTEGSHQIVLLPISGTFQIVWFYVLLQKDTKMHQLRLFRASFPLFYVNNFDLFRTIITLFMLKVEKELFQVLK